MPQMSAGPCCLEFSIIAQRTFALQAAIDQAILEESIVSTLKRA